MHEFYKKESLENLCGLVGKTRQAYYKHKLKKERQLLDAGIVVELVNRERRIAKRIGAKRLFKILKEELQAHHIKIGVQKFIEILRDNDLLVKVRRRRPKLTDSQHRLPVFPNKARNLVIDRSEQLWVSDITYIKVFDHFCYLILITDAYSRKVMGYHFSRKMNAAFCLKALDQALQQRCFPDRSLIHHTDRGRQYCSDTYVKRLKQNHITISMTENGDPLENPLAERMNRTFKDVFALDQHFRRFTEAEHQVHQAVRYYNQRLPHSSIDFLCPNDAHHRIGHLKKHWRYYWRENMDEGSISNFYTPK